MGLGLTWVVALDISKAFDRVGHAGLLQTQVLWNFWSVFGPILLFVSNRRLRVVLDGKFSQEYSVNVGDPQGSILDPILFLLYINDLPCDVICNIAIYADVATFYSKFEQASEWWQQPELAFELESDLPDTADCGRKGLVDSNAWKTHLASLITLLMWKWMGLFLRKKYFFKILGKSFSSKLNCDFYIFSVANTLSKKIGALILSMNFVSPKVGLFL